MTINVLHVLQLTSCSYFLIQFLLYLHKRHYETSRPIVRINFNKGYILCYSLNFLMVILLSFETIKNYSRNELFSSFIYYMWSVTTILVVVLFEIRRRTMHPMCYILFSYLTFTTSLCIIRYCQEFYELSDEIHSESSSIGILLILNLMSLIFSSISSYSPENSVIENNNPCPEEYSSIPSRILFMWLDRYIYSWFQNGIKSESTFDVHYQCVADVNTMNFKRKLTSTLKSKNNYHTKSRRPINEHSNVWWLTKALFHVFGSKLIISWCAIVFHIIFSFSRPFILKYLLKFISAPETPLFFGFTLAISFLITGILSSITQNCCFHLTSTTSLQVRSAIASAVYSKSININNEAKSTFTNAEIINLMSTDTDKIVTAIAYSWIVISSPFEIILIFAFLFNEIGSLASIGVLVLMGTFPLNSIAMSWLQHYQTEEMEWKDKRIKAMTEVLNNMKVIKLYSWESLFFKIISRNREKEVNLIRLISLCSGVVNIIWDTLPMSVLLTMLWTYVNIFPNYVITAEATFVSVVLLNMLRSPMAVLPYGITIAMNTSDHINISINKGELVGIVGKIASGKTSLLNAIIGEMCILDGAVSIKGSMSYVPQNPWIRKISTKDNIILSKKYIENDYKNVIRICDLDFDLRTNQADELNGVDRMLCSGGQRQRINLARAVYQKSEIYLLDDPLSALDAVVAQKVFEKVISNNGILANTTRLFVTQNINFLNYLDKIIFLDENGSIKYYGDVSNISNDAIDFMKIKSEKSFTDPFAEHTESIFTSNNNCVMNRNSCRIHKILHASIKSKYHQINIRKQFLMVNNSEINKNSSNSRSLSQSKSEDFDTEIKSVSYKAYFKYFLARGSLQLFCSIFAFGILTILQVLSSYWLEKLTSDPNILNNTIIGNFDNKNNNNQNHNHMTYSYDYHATANYYMLIYGLIGFGQIIFACFFYLTFSLGNANASKAIHDCMLNKVLKSKLQYFHQSSSQILNFFSKDIDNIDSLIPNNLSEVINCIFQVMASFFVILHTFPLFLLLIVPIGLLYFIILKFYLPSACQTQMLCVKSSSPIFRFFNETLQGRPVIRASKQKKHFQFELFKLLNDNTKFLYIQNVLNLWLSLRLDFLGNILVFGSVIMAICYRNKLTPSLVGLTISYSIDIIDLLNWMIIQYVDLETNSMALERLSNFNAMESEFNDKKYLYHPDSEWPRFGKIEFKKFNLKYVEDCKFCLNNINLVIEHGEKIGIVGRTGSGKTSLVQSLFKLVEPIGGSLLIDDIDIRDIDITDVRRAITMFPQESTIFSGTIRQNIDPFNFLEDHVLKQALNLSHLGPWLESINGNLDFDCGDNGSSLSVGQRQLLCLARVILRNSKIIVLDEATASVDQETDRLIMETIKHRFINSTILIIAHRTSGLEDLDKIIVMDRGEIIEFGKTREIINNPNGYFSKCKLYEC